jgi:hypothetical protein
MTTVAEDNNTQDWAADCDEKGWERVVRDGRDSGVVMMAAAAEHGGGGRQWWRWTATAMADDNSSRWRRGQMMTACKIKRAGYEEEGGGRAANNNGIRSAGQRAWNKNKEISLCKKTFSSDTVWYGLSGWSYHSCQKQTLFLLDLSVFGVCYMSPFWKYIWVTTVIYLVLPCM